MEAGQSSRPPAASVCSPAGERGFVSQVPARRSEPQAEPVAGAHSVARTATSYFPTDVRWPGVSSAGIALKVASARL